MNSQNVKKSAVGSVVASIVLMAASATVGWIACELYPKGNSVQQNIPQATETTVAAVEV